MGEKGIGRGGADVEEEGAVIGEDAFDFGSPGFAPVEEVGAAGGVVEGAVVDAEVVRRRGDDEVVGRGFESREDFEAVAVEKFQVQRAKFQVPSLNER